MYLYKKRNNKHIIIYTTKNVPIISLPSKMTYQEGIGQLLSEWFLLLQVLLELSEYIQPLLGMLLRMQYKWFPEWVSVYLLPILLHFMLLDVSEIRVIFLLLSLALSICVVGFLSLLIWTIWWYHWDAAWQISVLFLFTAIIINVLRF